MNFHRIRASQNRTYWPREFWCRMRRREFITLLAGAAVAWPLGARAQQTERTRRVGVLMGVADDAEGQARVKGLQQGLQELGWIEGRNVRIDYRWTGGDAARIRTYAAELTKLSPDVIVAHTPPHLQQKLAAFAVEA